MIYILDGMHHAGKTYTCNLLLQKYPNAKVIRAKNSPLEAIETLQNCFNDPDTVYIFDRLFIFRLQVDKYIGDKAIDWKDVKKLNTFIGRNKSKIKFIYFYTENKELYKLWKSSVLITKPDILKVDFFEDYQYLASMLTKATFYDQTQAKIKDIIG